MIVGDLRPDRVQVPLLYPPVHPRLRSKALRRASICYGDCGTIF